MTTPSRTEAVLAAFLAAAAVAARAESGQGTYPPAQSASAPFSAPWQRPGYPPLRAWYPPPAAYQRAYGLRPPGYRVPPYRTYGRAPAIESGPPDIIATLEESEEFSTLLQTLDRAQLTELLRGEGPYTILAPSNAAFDALPDGLLEKLLDDVDQLKTVLEYHIAKGRLTAADLLVAGELGTLEGHTVEIDDLSVQRADLKAGNGIIHVVDKLMAPPLF